MPWTPDGVALRGRVALVAGATRGAGRGIAVALGEAGATVICTGRSSSAGDPRITSEYDSPETIEETAALVTEAGGVGQPVQVDHLESDQVAALASRVRDEHGHLDVLVNDIWGGRSSRARRRCGTGRCGSTISTPGCGSCDWPSRPISSPPTICFRCWWSARAACWSR